MMIKRRMIQGLLILALLCGAVLLAHPSAAWAAMSGDGSKDDPYQIRTVADLQEFASLVNSGNTAACAVLTTDIDLNGSTSEQWTPIGNNTPYTGTFDGQRHTISGLYIDSDAQYIGLFGYIGEGGTVQDLTLAGSYISGGSYVGGICGYNRGSITSCSNSGDVSGTYVGGICGYNNNGSITNCSNSGDVSGTYVGGICGWNYGGSITSCSNSGDVSGTYVGGICGYNYGGRITNCSNSGHVSGSSSIANVGGICGYNKGSITNCSNSGPVTGSYDVGGICGRNYEGSITNCSNSGDVSGTYVGGICGYHYEGSITNCSNSGTVTVHNSSSSSTAFVGGICGYHYEGSITNCYWLTTGTAEKGVGFESGTSTNVESKTADQYASGEVAWLLNEENTSGPWRQNLSGNDKDEFPTLDQTHGTVVQLTFNANTGNDEDNRYQYANSGDTVSVPGAPDYQGHTFVGWYDNEDCTGDKVTTITATDTDNQEYWAKWTVNTYTVNLNANDGTIAEDKNIISYIYGVGATLPTEQDITRIGYTFDGWYDNAAFSGAPVTGITTTDFGDKTYYAKWTANTYKVTLNTNNGTINSGNVTGYTYGTATALPTDVTRPGYTFAGWYEDEALSGEPETAIPANATGAKTYYAKWTANTYKVTLNTNNGTINSGNITDYTYGIETTLPTDVTRAGYTFAGWYDNEALEGDAVTTIPADAMGDKEYWAKWTAKSYPSAPPTVSEKTIDAIADAQPGETVTVDLSSGDTTLDKEVFETLAGKDVTLVVDLGDGVSWTVKGSDVPEDADFTDIDMGVTMNSDGIPVEVVNAITGERGSVQLELAHDGAFGFTMTLTAPLGAENAGYWANLYHFDESTNKMTFETAAPIGSDGSVSLALSHASQYAIVIDDHNHGIVTLPFTDVREGDWFYDPVCYVYSQGLMTGTSATTFEPNTHLSRAMLVAVLHRLEGSPQASAGDFTDVADGDWYAQAVNWAASVGVVNGFDDGTFQPNAAITREQLAAILRNYAAYKGIDVTASGDLSTYSDAASVSTWAKDSVEWAVGSGLLGGYEDSTLRPQGLSTRAQVAAVLERYLTQS